MASDELAAWLRLLLTPGLGRALSRRLLAAFSLPQNVFQQSPAALRAVVGPKLADSLCATAHPSEELAKALDAHLQWLHQADSPSSSSSSSSRAIITLGDPRYPGELLQTADPPLVLFAEGQPALLQHPNRLAIVGSRHPTPQGEDNAFAFAQALGEAGLCIVSGLAQGVDAKAHEGALEAHAPTIAVVGTGLDQTYPKRHLGLARRIVAEGGLMLSEYMLGTPPLAAHFPQRNRIISGLSQGTLVVEAAVQSGSLITARQALEQGREVFAIPGSIHAPQAKGCHALIRQGAKLVESAQDVLEDLRLSPVSSAAQMQRSLLPLPDEDGHTHHDNAPSTDDPLLREMGYDPIGLDALQARTGYDTPTLQARLLDLELDGVIARLPGNVWQRRGGA